MLSIPNFFPGQPLDYQDFNRLSRGGLDTLSFLLKNLFPLGGIVKSSQCFEISYYPESMKAHIGPGIAINEQGTIICCDETIIVDLHDLKNESVIFSVIPKPIATHPFQDHKDPRISGFLTKAYSCEIVKSLDKVPAMAVELFRTQASTSQPKENENALIHLNYRRLIDLAGLILEPKSLESILSNIQSIDKSHKAIQKIFLLPDMESVQALLIAIETTLYENIISQRKIELLFSKLLKALFSFYGALSRRIDSQIQGDIWQSLIDLCSLLKESTSLRNLSDLSKDFLWLENVAKAMSKIVKMTQDLHSTSHIIREQLSEQKMNFQTFPKEVVFGTLIFKKISSIDAISIKTNSGVPKSMQATFLSGQEERRKGLFCRSETIEIPLEIKDMTSPIIIQTPTLQNRNDFQVQYSFNGKTLETMPIQANAHWNILGIYVPSQYLNAIQNSLSIHIVHTDSTFGIFDLHIYQSGESL